MKDFLRAVDILGEKVHSRFEKNGRRDFTRIAFEETSQVNFSLLFREEHIEGLRERHREVVGSEFRTVFSDEAFILSIHPDFSIEVYHWEHSDTGIHDHHFEGAFQCLKGEDHQVEFKFESGTTHFPGLEEGTLSLVTERILGAGDTQAISDDDQFIHAVAHSPSTFNLCVRTKRSKDQVLRNYLIDGIRYKFDEERNSRMEEIDLTTLPKLETMDSYDLLHLFQRRELRRQIDQILKIRHGFSYKLAHERNLNFLGEMMGKAKGF